MKKLKQGDLVFIKAPIPEFTMTVDFHDGPIVKAHTTFTRDELELISGGKTGRPCLKKGKG